MALSSLNLNTVSTFQCILAIKKKINSVDNASTPGRTNTPTFNLTLFLYTELRSPESMGHLATGQIDI